MGKTVEKKRINREHKLKTAIKTLGGGKNKIAAALKAKKIKGVRGSTESCPLAKFIKKLFPKSPCAVKITQSCLSVVFQDGIDLHLSSAKAIDDFIEAFDSGNYDFLSDSKNQL